jgi:ADP-ribose pyrophosphatase YjhB (NUDIX family)
MKRKLKVGAFIIRPSSEGRHDLLLFTHPDFPDAAIQMPGGSVENGEEIEAALHREIAEETGLDGLIIVRKLGVSEVPVRDHGILIRHCYLLAAPQGVADEWIHVVQGSGEDKELRFAFAWHRIQPGFTLTGDLGYFLNPEFLPELYS